MSRWRFSAAAAVLAGLGYLAALAFVDSGQNLFAKLSTVAGVLPVVMLASLGAYWVRSLRWLWLLRIEGYSVPPRQGWLCYLTGLAFTASPGKVGELVRMRYFGRLGVPHRITVACFVFERMLDLVVLLAFAALLAGDAPGIGLAVGFVVLILLVIAAIASLPRGRQRLQHAFRRAGFNGLARWTRIALGGVEQIIQFLPPRYFLPAATLGVVAWAIQCAGFALAMRQLGIVLPWEILFAVPAAAMLIGAASMVPGGIGTTEAATVVLLTHFGAGLDVAVIAAVAVRLGSIWFASILGVLVLTLLELRVGAPAPE